MRLFIALNFGKELLDAITGVQAEMRKLGIRGNYTKPANIHLTLAFIGEYNDPAKVTRAIRSVQFEPFKLTLSRPGRFGDLRWLGFTGTEELEQYVVKLKKALAAEGIPFDGKRFTPHVTLVRRADGPELPESAVPGLQSTLSRVSLMRSDRTDAGMRYTEIGFQMANAQI
jgi:2'-5' RNA ligase